MTDKSRTERRLIASIRQVKTGDETPPESNASEPPEKTTANPASPEARPRTAPTKAPAVTGTAPAEPMASTPQQSPSPAMAKPRLLKSPVKTKADPAARTAGYQSPGRVWPD